MKTITFFLLGILSWQLNLSTSKQVELATTKEAEISQHSKNNFPNIEVSYTQSMHIDEEELQAYSEDARRRFKSRGSEDKFYTLKIKDMESIYQLTNSINNVNEERSSTKRRNTTGYLESQTSYYKDFETGRTTLQLYLEEDKIYLIEEELPTYDWKITDEIVEISGYTCKSATNTSATGYTIKVWYTEDIPISNGPEKYHGLPGLILKVQSINSSIYATKISFPEQLTIKPLTEGEKIPRSEIDNIVEFIKKIYSLGTQKVERNEDGSTTKTIISGDVKVIKISQ